MQCSFALRKHASSSKAAQFACTPESIRVEDRKGIESFVLTNPLSYRPAQLVQLERALHRASLFEMPTIKHLTNELTNRFTNRRTRRSARRVKFTSVARWESSAAEEVLTQPSNWR